MAGQRLRRYPIDTSGASHHPSREAGPGDGAVTAHMGILSDVTEADPVVYEQRGQVCWVTLTGDIDYAVQRVAAPTWLDSITTDGEIVVDMDAVTFLDSMGIRFLVSLRSVAGAGVRLVNVPVSIAKLLTMTGLDQTFIGDAPA